MAKRTELVEIAAAPAAYPGTPNVVFTFNARTLLIVNEEIDPNAVAFISFDGSTDAAKLVPGTPNSGLVLERQARELFVRGVLTPSVSVVAED